MSKVKHVESLLANCDILPVQETWALSDQVGKLNQYFDEYNTYGASSINANELLSGRPYGGVSFLFKKSMSPNIKLIEIGSKRVCCIGVNTDMGLVYLFNVYMPCDTNTNEHLCDYNMILTDIAKYCDENRVLNCVIGGDMNTDMSRTKSDNNVSLRNFIRDENLNLVLNNVDNSVEYTYRGINIIV